MLEDYGDQWGMKMADVKQRKLLPAPETLVADGKFNFGTFSSQFQKVNPLDAHKPLGIWLSRPLLNLRLKEWQAFQLGNRRWFMLVVLYNAKVSALAQFIAYDKERKRKHLFQRVLPSWRIKVPDSLWNTAQSFHDKDCFIELVSQLSKGRFYINVHLSGNKELPETIAHFEAFHDNGLVQPIVVSIPFGKNRGMYSHKCLMPMQGNLSLGNEKVEFSSQESFAIIDDHKGFYPYVMKYDWVTGAGFNNRGQLTGFNLTDNQSIDPDEFNENCLWVNGKLELLPPVKFSRPDGVDGDWLVRDQYGMVDLVFKPEMIAKIDMNYIALRVKYAGPFGYFSGFIKSPAGHKVNLDQYFGMGEEKYIRG